MPAVGSQTYSALNQATASSSHSQRSWRSCRLRHVGGSQGEEARLGRRSAASQRRPRVRRDNRGLDRRPEVRARRASGTPQPVGDRSRQPYLVWHPSSGEPSLDRTAVALSVSEAASGVALLGRQFASGLAVDRAGELGNDRPRALRDHEGLAFGELPDLLGTEGEDVVARGGAAPPRPSCQVAPVTRVVPTRSEISLLKAPSLPPPKTTSTFVRPSTVRAPVSPKIESSWRRAWAA
jgi:hypothetical protein